MTSSSAALLCGSFKEGFGKEVSPYRRVLAAIDNSYMSAKVFERALLLSQRSCSVLYAVNVIQTKLPYANSSPVAVDPAYHDLMRSNSKDLFEVVLRKAKEAGVNVTPVQLDGDPAEEILKFALDNDVELIVVGSKDKLGSIKNLGSVSSRIAIEAKCAVLIER
ncbi:MAG: universal stress protein [Caldisericales bacterium]|jgi:nucleotide-binding universal stress UspA family protein|nr:universal stress protein [Caldisericales bacterium]